MTSVKGAIKRVKRQVKESQNPLFEQWLFEWKEEAAKNGSEMQYCFGKALRSLKKYPFKLQSGQECFIIENFGKKMCYMLDKKLEEFKAQNPDDPRLEEGPKTPVALNNNEKKVTKKRKSKTTPDSKNNVDQDAPSTEEGKAKKKKNDYVPAYRSGGYALILTLFETTCVNCEKEHMTKAELQDAAQSLCDTSLKRPDPGTFYSGWNSMSTLIKNELVTKQSNPPKFKLTEKGVDLAIKLKLSSNDIEKGVANNVAASNSSPAKQSKSPKPKKSPIKKNVQNHKLSLSPVPCSSKSPDNYKLIRDSLSPSGSERDLSPAPSDKSGDTIVINYDLENDAGKNNELSVAPSHDLQKYSSETYDGAYSQNTVTSATSHSSEPEETIFLLPGTFDIILLVDTQETESKVHKSSEVTLRALKSCGVNFEVRHLKVGDFTWICKDRINGHELVLPYIVERKRMDDLGSSIKDGRFHEQKFRLKQCGLENLIYLVEKYGNDNQRLGLPLPTLQQASWNTQIIDGFTVKVSRDHQDSMKYLNFMTVHLNNIFKDKTLMSCKKSDLPPCNVSDDLISLMTFKDFNKGSQKTKKFTIRDMLVKQLIQLRGMSVEKALAITQLYPTPKLLISAMNEPNIEKKISNLTYGPTKRSLGPVLAKSIYQLYTSLVLK